MSRRLHSAPSLPGVVLAVLATAAIVAAVLLSLGRQLEQVSTDPAIAASEGNGDTVRISAVKSDDGSVTVALQERSGGEWGERQLPRFRVLPADAPTGAWLNSSELTTSGAGAADDTLYCVISHGEPGDQFWRLLRGYVRQAELDLGINVRFFSSLQGSDQAATIEQCSADGAAVIAATLANPVAITDSLLAAKAAGARIITFNSGSEHAEAAGAEIHISLDDVGAGSLAAETFSQRGVTGTIACLIHEAANVGLESRCDGLEDAYAGDQVIRLRLPDDLEPSEVTDWIAQRLTDPDGPAIHAVLTLNADTQLQALDAIFQTADQLDYDVQNANIGGNSAVARLFG